MHLCDFSKSRMETQCMTIAWIGTRWCKWVTLPLLLQEDNTPKHTGPAALFECYTNDGTDILLLWQPPSFHFYKPVIPPSSCTHTNGAYSILSIHKRLSVCRASRSPGSFPCQRITCSCLLLLPLLLRKRRSDAST